MIRGQLPPASRYGTWVDQVEVRSEDDDQLADLSSATEITLKIMDITTKFEEMVLKKSRGDITLPSTGIIEWRVEQGNMGTMMPRLYEGLILIEMNGEIIPLFIGVISIVD